MKTVFSLKHILKLTDHNGIVEHCILSDPDYKEGYSVDDNARALLACLKIKGEEKKTIEPLISLYLKFLFQASDKKGFHQDLNSDLTWKDKAAVEEGYGRAMLALAETILSVEDDKLKYKASTLFDQQILLIPKIRHPRVMAQTVIALSQRIKIGGKQKQSYFEKKLINLAEKLLSNYQEQSSKSWRWFENVITYDNGRLPLSMFFAFETTRYKKYLIAAQESLDFLIKATYDQKKKCFSFVGNKGWYPKGKKPAIFDQQPIEAGSLVEACVKAYEILKDPDYLRYAKTALAWYTGKNILGLSMIDDISGGIYNGLTPKGVNLNEGAESVLSYIIACLVLKEIKN